MLINDDYSIAGVRVEVHVTPDGRFSVILDDETLGAGDTFAKAVSGARTQLAKRKVRVEVPFVTRDGKRGVATGIHAKTSKVLVRYSNGVTDQWDSWRGPFRAGIPQATLDDYLGLKAAVDKATRAMTEIEREYDISLSGEVRKAIEAAAAEAVAKEQ